MGTKEREGRREEAVPRSFDEKTATPKRFDDVVAKRPMDGVTEDSRERAGTSGGGGSRAGKAGVVAYSLEDYDGLTKDDSYVVIETQSSGSMFPLGLDSNQGQLDVNALATKLASLEAADRDGGHSVPPSRSLSSTSSDFKEVALEGGACHKVTITVDTIGTVVGWEFCTEPKGVAFGITYCRDDRQEEVQAKLKMGGVTGNDVIVYSLGPALKAVHLTQGHPHRGVRSTEVWKVHTQL